MLSLVIIYLTVRFTKVLTVEYGTEQHMLKIFLSNIYNISDETTVTMTTNHLLYGVNGELIRSDNIKIGDKLFGSYIVIAIENDKQYSTTPITFSGYLQVNG
eukprot:233928_1